MHQTPKTIKYLIFLTCGLSILTGIYDKIFPSFFPYLLWHLCLTVSGIDQYFYWQLITHEFIYPAFGGIQPLFLFNLALSMLILWRIGSAIVFRKGVKQFLLLYLLSGIFAGITAYVTLSTMGSPQIFCGASAAIFGLLTAAIMLYPELEIMLFLTIPVKGKWLILGILGSILLIDLSNGAFVTFFTNFTAFLTGYIYAVVVWRIRSPFHSMHAVDNILLRMTAFMNHIEAKPHLHTYTQRSKIYDFRTGQVMLNDEAFLEACLAKISEEGKSSLTYRERFRLWRISVRRRSLKKKRESYDRFRDQ